MANLSIPRGLGTIKTLPERIRPLWLVVLCLILPAGAEAQTGTVSVERENFRAAPQGTVVAEVLQGTELRLGQARDRWREATLEAWIWSASVQSESRDGHDLVVTASRGENLRAAPNGAILARARNGMLLERVEAQGNWIRVRRTAWVWEPSLEFDTAASAAGPRTPAAPSAEPGSSPTREFSIAGARGLVVLSQPAGDTLARVHQGGTVEVLARDGEWARVRVEGWTFTAGISGDDGEGGILRDLPRSDLARDPARYRGRLVEWSIQFIALQQAERFRTDFIEGESFILARGPGDDAGFVYVAVSDEQLDAVRRLDPLQRIRILGRIRSPRSTLTDAPVLDLLEIIRLDSARER